MEPLTTIRQRTITRRDRKRAVAITSILLAGIVLALAQGGVAPVSPDPGQNDLTLTSRTIWSYYTETPPSMDDPTDNVWDYPLEVLGLVPGHVALSGGTSLEIRSVYTDNELYFRIIWHDVVENSAAPRWVFHDGNWTFTSPFEDGLGLYFPITDPEGLFLDEGCMRTCHATDWENPENQERKFTLTEEETGDLWFWSSGLSNPWDFAIDAYVTDTPSANNVGYYEDPEMGLNLVKNRHLTEYMEYVYMSRPVYMQDPTAEPRYGASVLARGEEVAFDQNYFDPDAGEAGINPITHEPWKNGDVVGGYIMDHLPERGLGQIDARGSYDIINQQWSLVLRRELDTGDPIHDVIFDDLTEVYQFGLSLFGDIMGGGDASEPFIEPDVGEGDRCVMNKVTNTIGLRFRPVVKAARAAPGEPASWDGQEWAEGSTDFWHELIHRSGEIHDPWDWVNISSAYDDERLYMHLRYDDPNASEELMLSMAWLTPGMVSVEETFNLLDWSDIVENMVVEEGTADLWKWRWNATSLPEGEAIDMAVVDGTVHTDASGPDDLQARTWREDGSRHIVISRALDTGEEDDDIAFEDLARTYVMRMALYTTDNGEWFVTFPVSAAFQPDPSDTTPSSPLVGVTVTDGGDSDIMLEWDPSEDADFGQYRVYIQDDPFTDLQGLVPSVRISDMEVDSHHMRGIRPDRTYHVAVVAVDDNRNLPATVSPAEVGVTDTEAPPVPQDVKVFDNLDSDLLVSWDPGDRPDIEGYEIYLETAPFSDASSLEPVATVRGMRVSSFRVGGLEAGKTYHAAVAAVDWNENADRRVASVPGTPTDVVAPPEVRGLDASTPQAPDSEGEALVKWTASTADDVDHYNIYISLTPIDSLQNFAPWGTAPASQTSVVVDDLNAAVKYYFAVTAVDWAGHEGPSKYSVGSRASTAEPPEPVRGLAAVQAGEGSVRLAWESNNITGSPVVRYRVFMSLEPITDLADEDVTSVGNASAGPDPTILVTELEPGTTYYFCVDAVDDRGRISAGSLPSASVTLSVPPEEGTDLWEVYGPYVTIILIVVIIGLLAYVAMNRQRRFGRILSRRPSWEQNKNGGNGK